MSSSFLVIGGGLVGLATAYRLLERFPGARLHLVEKEIQVGQHQSTHNSGVLHAGLYYKPGSTKALMAVRGIRQMVDFCRAEDIAHEICGKLVVATKSEQVPVLEELLRRGAANGLKGLRLLTPLEMRRIEPHVAGVAAIHVPGEGIVDYAQVCGRLAARVQERGGQVMTGVKAGSLRRTSGQWVLGAPRGEFAADYLVNCAGLHCDRVARLAGETPPVRIVPFRGEYYKLSPVAQGFVRNLIYPAPDPKFPFLGVHFTRLIHGGVEAGPNAVLAFAREGYSLGRVNLRDLVESLAYPGLWRFLWKHPEMVRAELGQSISKGLFCRSLQRLVPEVQPQHLEKGGAGVRAQAMSPEGDLVQDFSLARGESALHVLNAPSPAATASLAIGEHIVSMIP
jgi:(S)-2-hydroxyglutarate dehydrogenase